MDLAAAKSILFLFIHFLIYLYRDVLFFVLSFKKSFILGFLFFYQ